ncbi:hypothetical protein M2189_006284 [Bradyrhizobium japonicum]|nr:hypothetical protein [Bradyrhizobium japonicum]MCS3963081.1 hypothetical protein [Bradyrhizobium japonicum]MCS3995394.1 hypothetical protein [Bradyrhizobium japonicum]
MQNPGDDECAQPVPRFYVTLRDTSEGIGLPPATAAIAMVREVGELSAHLVV